MLGKDFGRFGHELSLWMPSVAPNRVAIHHRGPHAVRHRLWGVLLIRFLATSGLVSVTVGGCPALALAQPLSAPALGRQKIPTIRWKYVRSIGEAALAPQKSLCKGRGRQTQQ